MDINTDAGEAFGRWDLGNDAALFENVTSVNIACGYHAGDPGTMRRTVALAVAAGVAIGAHPGYPDLLGFGRRAFEVSVDDAVDYVLYQVGALQAFVTAEGQQLAHVKPHGALYMAIGRSPELAVAVSRAINRVVDGIPMLLSPGVGADAIEAAGLPIFRENAVDLEFGDDGWNIIEPRPEAKDPALIAAQAVRMAGGTVLTTSGNTVPMVVDSMCIHGDRPNAPELARAVRSALVGNSVAVRPLAGGGRQ